MMTIIIDTFWRYIMKKLSRILVIMLAVVMLTVAVGALAACEPKDNEPDVKGYKFIVKDADGNLKEGIFVQLCQGENCLIPVATDADGVVTFIAGENYFEFGTYEVHLSNEDGDILEYSCDGVEDGASLVTSESAASYVLILK